MTKVPHANNPGTFSNNDPAGDTFGSLLSAPMDGPENPRAIIGGNAPPDHGRMAAERVEEEYGSFRGGVRALLDEAIPLVAEKITDDDGAGRVAKMIKRLRDSAAQCLSHHRVEKEPHLRAGQAIDRFFFGLHEQCARRERMGKPGMADILQSNLDTYTQAKLAEERRKRAEEERVAAAAARAAREKQEQAEREAEAARLAAARSRKPENKAAHLMRATDQALAAVDAAVDVGLTTDRLRDAQERASATPAEMVGTRTSDDVKITMKREAYCDVIDINALDMDMLWAFVSDDAKIKACKAWAAATGHKRAMPGASIGFRDRTVVR